MPDGETLRSADAAPDQGEGAGVGARERRGGPGFCMLYRGVLRERGAAKVLAADLHYR